MNKEIFFPLVESYLIESGKWKIENERLVQWGEEFNTIYGLLLLSRNVSRKLKMTTITEVLGKTYKKLDAPYLTIKLFITYS